MTISTTSSEVTILGNGSTIEFDFPFVGVRAEDIIVSIDNGTTLVPIPSGQYNIFLNPPEAGALWGVGGNVTYPLNGSPISSGSSIIIQRVLPYTQVKSIADQGNFYPATVERALDVLCMEIQQIAARTGKWRGTWETGVLYNVGDLVLDGVNSGNSGNIYMAINSHVSGTWGDDLASGDWVLAVQAALGTVPLPLSVANGGTGQTTLGDFLNSLGLGGSAFTNLGGMIVDDGFGNLTVDVNTVTNNMLAFMDSNTVKVRNAATDGDPVDMPVPINSIVGRGVGDIEAIPLGVGLAIQGGILVNTNVAPAGAGGNGKVLWVRNELSSGVGEPSVPTAGLWDKRTMNTVKINTVTGGSLINSQVTLPAGTYDIHAMAPANQAGQHKISWYNVTDAQNVIVSPSTLGEVNDTSYTYATLVGRFTITGTKTFEIRHRRQYGRSLGSPKGTNFGVPEVYTDVFIKETTGEGPFVTSDVNGITGSTRIYNMVSLSAASYAAIGTPDPMTLYVIVG